MKLYAKWAAPGSRRWVVSSNNLTDPDGNTYTIVMIGKQVWTVENLRTTKFNDGTPIPNVTDSSAWATLTTPGYCFYNNSTDTFYQKKWGALYNWYAVNTGNLAPSGWHVPADSDWTILQKFLYSNGYNFGIASDDNNIGKSLAAQTDWASSQVAGEVGNDLSTNNRTGFSALPEGERVANGTFYSRSISSDLWSSTEKEDNKQHTLYRDLYYIKCDLLSFDGNKGNGLSVRLVKS